LAEARELVLRKGLLPGHPVSTLFLDESGSISFDRFFSVGCLKMAEPSILIRQLEKWRDAKHWYKEIHFTDLTRRALPLYKEIIEIVASSESEFSSFIAVREVVDPLVRFGSSWKAYEKLATQLVMSSIRRGEIVSVLADSYSTPDGVLFEQDLRSEVNRRFDRLAVLPVVRLDSKAATPLQIVDLLTSAVTFEFRQNARVAGTTTPKAQLARHLRDCYSVHTFLQGCELPKISVQLHGASGKIQRHRLVPAKAWSSKQTS